MRVYEIQLVAFRFGHCVVMNNENCFTCILIHFYGEKEKLDALISLHRIIIIINQINLLRTTLNALTLFLYAFLHLYTFFKWLVSAMHMLHALQQKTLT